MTQTQKKSSQPVLKHATLKSALVAAQSELKNVSKDSINPHYKSRYTQLATLLEDVEPVLNKHGIGVYTIVEPRLVTMEQSSTISDEGGIRSVDVDGHFVSCILFHGDTGEEIISKVYCPKQQGPQPFGSFLTYMRRYLIQGLCGVAEDNDDDGESQQQKFRGNTQLREAVSNKGRQVRR